jgi:REP element-mobilizing transposase RayT
MSHTFTNLFTHAIFSTHRRALFIADVIRDPLHAYLGGIVREMRGTALAIGSTQDHVHMLLKLPGDLAVADCLRVAKANSSRWVHENWPERRAFGWQTGYGAFSVSASNCTRVTDYIRRQEKHHRKVSFEEEFISFLRKHGIEFDERYLWR